MQSSAERTYSSLSSQVDLEALIGQPEDLHIDVKEGRFPLTDDLKAYLSQALSGFANSDGGVLIFGMRTERASDQEPDVITGVRPFENPAGAAAEINHLLGSAVVPLVEGVRVESIQAERAATYGYVKVLVPASDSGPHRAMLGKVAREYWKRSGDSFYRMEHFDIADMFARRRKPKLEVTSRLVSFGIIKPPGGLWSCRLDMIFGLKNVGRSIARFPYIELRDPGGCRLAEFGLDSNGRTGLPRLLSSRHDQIVFGGGGDDVIHVGTVREVNRLTLAEISSDNPRKGGWIFEFAVSAEDHPMESHKVEITVTDVRERLASEGLAWG